MTPSRATPSARVVLVTGASSGIGLATALEAAGRGDRLVLTARSQESLERAAQQCRDAGASSVDTHPADVLDGAAVGRLVADVVTRHGRIDVAVHSAGVVAYGAFHDVPADVFEGVVSTNVIGTANVARAVLRQFRAARRGRLFLVGSVIGSIAVPDMSAYVVSKWGVASLARQLQLETRDLDDVHVTLVRPGSIDTPIYLQAANYAGLVGRPPPPVYGPETVARRVVAAFDAPPRVLDVGIANRLMVLGFTLVPPLFDALVGPLFRLTGRERTSVTATAGNVLEAQPDGERLRGRHAGLTGLAATLRGRRPTA